MSHNLPSISSYGQYESDNYGVNTLCVDLNNIKLYYSYKTIVAYYDIADGLTVCENAWSVTTGKHLNWIDNGNKKSRLPFDEFKAKLNAALERHIK